MKIAILTLPLHNNYGGLLQTYALQKVLKGMGHEPWLVRFSKKEHYRTCGWWMDLTIRYVKNFVRLLIGRTLDRHPNRKEEMYVSQYTNLFIERYISPISNELTTPRQLSSYCKKAGFDAYVVGSDQVWRPLYAPKISNYFLDFCKGRKVKRIAYAASFGTHQWEFSEKETKECRKLIKDFDAVSVREDSGVTLCRDYLDVIAYHMADPTLLLDRKDFAAIVEQENGKRNDGQLFRFFVDPTQEKEDLTQSVAKELRYTTFSTSAKTYFSKQTYAQDRESCVSPSVADWIASFMDAKLVITDSYHGCIFSIIFNKPFVAIANKGRGQSRFESLLRIFGLEQCQGDDLQSIRRALSSPIDWEKVNAVKEKLRINSLNFLHESLSDVYDYQ